MDEDADRRDLTTGTKSKLCLECMECCKIVAVRAAINPLNKRTKEFYQARGCRIIPTDQLPLVVIPYMCPHLSPQGCLIYDRRPLACRLYDGRYDPIMSHICLWGKVEKDA